MNTQSASRASNAAAAAPGIRVWDVPVRLLHWLTALCFAGAWLTAESERWQLIHITFGYTMAGLIAVRLIWGLAGTRYARFTQFVRGPAAVLRYLRSLLRGQPEHYTGHNPAGALAIVALLGLGAVLTFSGWATYTDRGGEWLEELHEGAANVMLALVLVHIAAVAVSSLLHRENLALAMVHGRKRAAPGETPVRARAVFGGLILAAVLAFWWWSWNNAPVPAGGAIATSTHRDEYD